MRWWNIIISNERTLYDPNILAESLKQTGKFCFLLLGIFPLSFHHGSWESTKVRCVLLSIPFLFSQFSPKHLKSYRSAGLRIHKAQSHSGTCLRHQLWLFLALLFFRSINNYVLHFNSYIISCTLSSFTLKKSEDNFPELSWVWVRESQNIWCIWGKFKRATYAKVNAWLRQKCTVLVY